MRPSSSYALPEPSSSSPSSSSPPPSSSSSAPPPPPPPPRPAPAIDLNAPSSSPKSQEEASLLPTTRNSSDCSLRKSSGSEEDERGGSRESRQVVFDGLPTLSLEQEGSDEVGGSRSVEAPFKSKGGPSMSVSLRDFFPSSLISPEKEGPGPDASFDLLPPSSLCPLSLQYSSSSGSGSLSGFSVPRGAHSPRKETFSVYDFRSSMLRPMSYASEIVSSSSHLPLFLSLQTRRKLALPLFSDFDVFRALIQRLMFMLKCTRAVQRRTTGCTIPTRRRWTGFSRRELGSSFPFLPSFFLSLPRRTHPSSFPFVDGLQFHVLRPRTSLHLHESCQPLLPDLPDFPPPALVVSHLTARLLCRPLVDLLPSPLRLVLQHRLPYSGSFRSPWISGRRKIHGRSFILPSRNLRRGGLLTRHAFGFSFSFCLRTPSLDLSEATELKLPRSTLDSQSKR